MAGLNAVASKEKRWRNAFGELAMDELAVELLIEPSQLWRCRLVLKEAAVSSDESRAVPASQAGRSDLARACGRRTLRWGSEGQESTMLRLEGRVEVGERRGARDLVALSVVGRARWGPQERAQ